MRRLEGKNKRSFKKLIIILSLLLLVVVLPPVYTSAEVITEEDLEGTEKPSIIEKQFSKLLMNLANSLIGLSKAQDVTVLVYQRPDVVDESQSWVSNTSSAERDELVFGIFPQSVFNGIAVFYDQFAQLLPIPILVILVIAGILLLFDVLRSVDNRSKAKEYLLGVIFAVLLIRFGHLLWDWIIYINFFIVDLIYFLLKENNIHITSFISTIWNPTNTDAVLESPSLMIAILVICAAFMTFAVNYQYTIRIIITGVLIVLFPLVVIATVIPSKRNSLTQWFGLFTSQIFIQSAQAIALGLFFFFLANAQDWGFWLIMTMFFGLPMITDLVQRTISGFLGEGFGGGIGTSMSNASGMSSMMGLMMLGKNLVGNKNGKASKESTSKKNATANGVLNDTKSTSFPTGSYNSTNETTGKGLQTASGLSAKSSSSVNTAASSKVNDSSSAVPINGGNGIANDGVPMTNSAFLNKANDSLNMQSQGVPNKINRPSTQPKTRSEKNMQRNQNSMGNRIQQTAKAASQKWQQSQKPLGKTVSRIGNQMAHSNGLKKSAKIASAIALGTAGYAIGTMTTGKGGQAATIGGMAGLGVGTALSSGIEKGGKTVQVGGEVLQSKADGNEAFALTKERLGYHDSAQLSDSQEMARMGKELIGGKTGEMLGSVAGKVNYTGGKYNIKPPNNFDTREAYNAVIEKANLDQNVLPKSENRVVDAQQKMEQAKSRVEFSKAQAKANPSNPKNKERIENAEKYYAKTKLNYETKKINHETLKNKANNFYENQKLIKRNESLRQNRKSSGQL